jgi:uncharacterized membrane protein YfcA
MFNIILLFIAGSIAGIMAGLLGLGGATIMVPLYLYYFKLQNLIPPQHQFHMAVGCSLAVILVSSIIASINNYRLKLIQYTIVKRFLPGLIIGIFMGTGLSHFFQGLILKKLFAIFLMVLVFKLFLSKSKSGDKNKPLSPIVFHGVAILIGILNALFGVAGGIIMVPFFIQIGIETKKAIATSIFLAIPISLIANLSLNLTSDYFLIDWQVVIPTAITSAIFIPMGSKLGRSMSSDWLTKIFAVFLFFVSVEMLVS